jgi:uncharacterized UPF0160 family protein
MSVIAEITNHGINDTRVTTHDKKFHADDVMAVSLIDMYCKDGAGVIRTRNPRVFDHVDLIVDVGRRYGGRFFDHHQPFYTNPYGDCVVHPASAGLVWADIGHELLTRQFPSISALDIDAIYDYFTRKFIHPIDARDNGQFYLTMASATPFGELAYGDIITNYLCGAGDDDEFAFAVDFTRRMLPRMFERCKRMHDVYKSVNDKFDIENKQHDHIFCDQSREFDIAYDALGFCKNIKLVVNKTKCDNLWYIRTTYDQETLRMRYPAPLRWRNCRNVYRLREVSCVPGAMCCSEHGYFFTMHGDNRSMMNATERWLDIIAAK